MTAPQLIGLVGRARSGKDAAADILVAEAGFEKAAMADPLRRMAAAVNPIVGTATRRTFPGSRATVLEVKEVSYLEALETYGYEEAKDRYPEVRRFLQRLGTEGVRDVLGAGTWITLAERRIASAETPLVFTDIRFPNEARMIKRCGGTLVGIQRAGTAPVAAHASEDVDQLIAENTDHVIDNNGTIDDLTDAVLELVSQ